MMTRLSLEIALTERALCQEEGGHLSTEGLPLYSKLIREEEKTLL